MDTRAAKKCARANVSFARWKQSWFGWQKSCEPRRSLHLCAFDWCQISRDVSCAGSGRPSDDINNRIDFVVNLIICSHVKRAEKFLFLTSPGHRTSFHQHWIRVDQLVNGDVMLVNEAIRIERLTLFVNELVYDKFEWDLRWSPHGDWYFTNERWNEWRGACWDRRTME